MEKKLYAQKLAISFNCLFLLENVWALLKDWQLAQMNVSCIHLDRKGKEKIEKENLENLRLNLFLI